MQQDLLFLGFNALYFNALQAEWGPLRHVRVIKERSTGISRGFAFIDFPSVVFIMEYLSLLATALSTDCILTVSYPFHRKLHAA